MVVYACNPSTQEAKARRSGVHNPSQLYSKFKASMNYMRLRLKTKRGSKMAQQVKESAAKTDDLSLTPRTYRVVPPTVN